MSMQVKLLAVKIILIVAALSLSLGGCSYLNRRIGLDDDHHVEEAVEGAIEDHTGWNIDLSPASFERSDPVFWD